MDALPFRAVSYFLLEAKLQHDGPLLTDTEEETLRLSDRSRAGKSQSWASTQGGQTLQ